ncbi:MAG: adenylate kinase family protein [Methanobacteriaceae archaeon]|jgi:adenylate kinase|nr:MAG: adenylate kinase [Methanobacterium sp. BRmetb2]MCC7558411.1 adenylate kinase family protein [Methanobacteriaceae archaeon]
MPKLILITGTPGVGKSTIASMLAKKINGHLIPINQVINDKKLYTGYDREKNFKIVDLNALCSEMEKIIAENQHDVLIVEGHLSHYIEKADIVIVLRTNPQILGERLKQREYSADKINENMEAEAIDLCTFEAFEIHGHKVNEIDNSELSPDEVVDLVIEIIKGNKKFQVGKIDFSEFLMEYKNTLLN